MKYFNSWKRSNGSVTTQEWSASEMFNYDFVTFVVMLVVGSFLAVVTSLVCLLIRLYDYESNDKAPNVWGIIFATYYLIDWWRGWVVNWILGLFGAPLTLLAVFNITMLITHVLLLALGDTVYYNITDESQRKSKLLIITVLIAFLTYEVAKVIV